ncbi:hypothetical protein AAMO2058_001574700 [Amorphochlora amoebiformis]
MGVIDDVFRITYGKSVKGRVSHSVIYWIVTFSAMIVLVVFYALAETTVQEQSTSGGSGCTRNAVSINTEAGSFTSFQPGGNCTDDALKHIQKSDFVSISYATISAETTAISLTVAGTVSLTSALTTSPIRSNGINVIAKCSKFSAIGAFTSACNSGHVYTDGDTAYTVNDLLPWNIINTTLTYDTASGAIGTAFQDQLKAGVVVTIEYLCVVVDAASTYTCDKKIRSTPYQVFVIALTLTSAVAGYVFTFFDKVYGPDADEEDSIPGTDKAKDTKEPETVKSGEDTELAPTNI